jgi:hypothetical protein
MYVPSSTAHLRPSTRVLGDLLLSDSDVSWCVGQAGPAALLHLDSDIYSAASFVLRTLIADRRIVRGTVIVFDELFNYCGFENHESLALYAPTSVYRNCPAYCSLLRKGYGHDMILPRADMLSMCCNYCGLRILYTSWTADYT